MKARRPSTTAVPEAAGSLHAQAPADTCTSPRRGRLALAKGHNE
jgi:hypothetical protein